MTAEGALEPLANEVTLQGALGRGAAELLSDDGCDVCCGALGLLAFQLAGQLEQLFGGARLILPRIGHQCIEAASPPRADPAIERGSRHPHARPLRGHVVALGQRAHELTALAL